MQALPFLRVEDIAFVRFSVPDLDATEAFLNDFGLARAQRTPTQLYMRGTDAAPFLYFAERGPAQFLGAGFTAPDLPALTAFARALDLSVEDCPWIGGGKMVAVTDPNGFAFHVVADQARPNALNLPKKPLLNDAAGRPRIDATTRMTKGPSTVKRLGHLVLNVKNYRESRAWFERHFGLIVSDEIQIAGPGSELGAFMRCDRGETPTDHHTLFIVGAGAPKFNHAAFEVAHMDDLMRGHQHLKDRGAQHEWMVYLF